MCVLKEELLAAMALHWIRLLIVITAGKQVVGECCFLWSVTIEYFLLNKGSSLHVPSLPYSSCRTKMLFHERFVSEEVGVPGCSCL